MPTGKSRSKRTAGTTPSTTTILIILSLSGLLIWLITSNPFAPSGANSDQTVREATAKIATGSDSHQSTSAMREPHPVHEDVPGEFPGGATKSVDVVAKSEESAAEIRDTRTRAEKEDASSSSSDPDPSSNESAADGGGGSDEKSDEVAVSASATEMQEKPPENENDVPKVDEGETKAEEKANRGTVVDATAEKLQLQGKESAEEHEKQMALETQTSEESSVTQKQVVEQTAEDNPRVENQPVKNDDQEKGNKNGSSEEIKSENQLSNEDNLQRVEDVQKQEDDQIQIQSQEAQSKDPHGATSEVQIQHDEATIEDGNGSKEEANTQSDNHENKQDLVNEEPNKSENVQTDQEKSAKKDNEASSSFPNGESSGIPKESHESKKSWSTQADQSDNENERRKAGLTEKDNASNEQYSWQLCNETSGGDYIPCLDNNKDIAKLLSRSHYEHRERHCPKNAPTCLVPLPPGYKRSVQWPQSRDKIWYNNVPHTLLAEVKGHQNWVKVTGEFLTFPGGGTQFIHGALHYLDFIQEAVPDIAWGKHTRVVLDVGCGVASLGGYLFERDVLTMSFAPKDEHEAQVQFALERGIPAISAVMGTQRLPFPSRVFDVVHCARCRVPWHADGGMLLLELNRVLRPGGYFVWSATPVYQNLEEDVQIWKEMSNLTVAMCWELVTIKKDALNSIGAAIYQKPDSNDCYEKRQQNHPPMCKNNDDPNAAWYVPLQPCMHKVPMQETERGSQWPEEWPDRLQSPPYWLNKSQMGIYGKPSPDDFTTDYKHWKNVVTKSYMNGLGIDWSNVRNVMDMRAVYGGFAAAMRDLKVWVMNVVNVDSPDTLPVIYERGLFGVYHDWCESFSTYPRTYDLLHADHLFPKLKKRCNLAIVMAEIDRIVRPGGKLIVRDESNAIREVERLLKSLHWEVFLNFSKNQEGILSAQKSEWRPDTYAPPY